MTTICRDQYCACPPSSGFRTLHILIPACQAMNATKSATLTPILILDMKYILADSIKHVFDAKLAHEPELHDHPTSPIKYQNAQTAPTSQMPSRRPPPSTASSLRVMHTQRPFHPFPAPSMLEPRVASCNTPQRPAAHRRP